ncbi:hypothetical protein PV08_01148 [Exophiala spinifera]|uniref:Uncharacterized protein n=1 Tax=Exophiala spinifera TaxID=91928 RepID=A0A0D2BNU7_9EURO|nr:uncharacterized protein PV08_01148 [Exophiala spinifera]KIW20573.1 hypothetical protein PV08_01148 [Exophiala spinifera]
MSGISKQISESLWNYRSVYKRVGQIITLCLKRFEGDTDQEPRADHLSQRIQISPPINSSTLKLYYTVLDKTGVLTGTGCAGKFVGCLLDLRKATTFTDVPIDLCSNCTLQAHFAIITTRKCNSSISYQYNHGRLDQSGILPMDFIHCGGL